MSPSDPRSDLPPEQDAVRRLLAEARHDEPVPPAVAARLDAVLEELTAERRQVRREVPVDLAARRRRRGGAALLAAAAVVVAGVGLGQVLGGGEMSDLSGADTASDAGGSAAFEDSDGSGDRDDSGGNESHGEAGATAPESSSETDEGFGAALSADTPEVSSDSLRRDLSDALAAARAAGPDSRVLPDPAWACGPDEAALAGQGRVVPVTLDGRPALALYRVPQGSRRVVDVYLCGTAVPEGSVTLRAR